MALLLSFRQPYWASDSLIELQTASIYIWIRGWCTPNGIVHHWIITELWPFVSWKNDFFVCVRSHILEVVALTDVIETWYEYGIYMDKRMMHVGVVHPSRKLLCPEVYLRGISIQQIFLFKLIWLKNYSLLLLYCYCYKYI